MKNYDFKKSTSQKSNKSSKSKGKHDKKEAKSEIKTTK